MNKTWRRALILGGLLTAFALRVYKLGDQNIWWDEGLSVLAARMSFTGTTLWTAADVHPPLYFWLLWPWARLAGESEFALRFITVMESLLAAALMVPLGRRLTRHPAVGVAALWLLALSRFHIWWSQEMRMYVLAGLCSLLSLYFTIRIADAPRQWRNHTGWVLATLGAFHTVYSSIVLVPIENLFMLVAGLRRPDRRRFWGRWILTQALVGLGMLPWLALALPRMRSWSVVQEPAALSFVLELNAVLLTLGISTDVGRYAVPAFGVMAIAAAGSIVLLSHQDDCLTRRTRRQRLFLAGLGVLMPPLVIWALAQPRGFFYNPRVEARYLLPFAPVFYLLLAWASAGFRKVRRLRGLTPVALAAVLGLFAWTLPQHYTPRYFKDAYTTLTRTLWAYAEPGDAVLLVSGDRYPIFSSYYDRAPAPANRPPVYRIPQGAFVLTEENVADELASIAARYQRLWLVQIERTLQDPEGLAEVWLAARYPRTLSSDFGYNNLSLFDPSGAPPTVPMWNLPPQHEISATLASGVTLHGYDLLTREFRALDIARVGVYLEAGTDAQIPVAMTGNGGFREEIILDVTSQAGLTRHEARFQILPYTPPGQYTIEIATAAGSLPLGELRVTHTYRAANPDRAAHPMDAQIGEQIRLLGYDLEGARRGDPPQARAGDTLQLQIIWMTPERAPERYTVFTHLIGAAYNPATQGPLWAQDDQTPLEGAYPTDLWIPNIPLRDTYSLTLPPNIPPGRYQLMAGLYAPETGERLAVQGEGALPEQNAILLTSIDVVP
ncbi:MAG: glycosyltransferase family 39 protein [Anaerolineae bacterium]|nr:glycosyltransferase family 39 protein [Anaerolineae bacterium]